MEDVILHPGMGVVLTAAGFIGNMCPVPGPQTIVLALQAIKDAVEQAKWRREECQRLSEKCQNLVSAFDADRERIHKTGLKDATEVVELVLLDVRQKITEFSSWGRMKALYRNDDMRRDLESCDADIDHAITKLRLTAGNEAVRITNEIKCLQKSEPVIARMNAVTELQKACSKDSGYLKTVSVDDLQKHSQGSVDFLHRMQTNMYDDDAKLQIEGVRVDRTQFNAVYKDIMDALHMVHVATGVQFEVRNLKREVWKNPLVQPCDGGDLTELYEGCLHGNERVMIKCLRGIRNADEATKVRILNAVKVWATFRHPRVHTFIGITDNYYYLSMVSAFYKEGNLMRYTKQYRKKNKYHLLAGTVEGLIYLHEVCKVCHGNLRGNNVLINDEGEPLVADFEMSKLLTNVAKDLQLETATLTRQPSPRWKAPEIMGTNLQPTFKSDVWSVGMLMLEVLTGFVPFHLYRRNEQVMFQVSHYGLRPSRPENNKQIHDDAWKLMEDCWATEPEDRPALRDVHARLLKLEAWWEEAKPEPEEEPSSMSMRKYTAYMYD